MLRPIRFSSENRPYGFLSNFYPAPVVLAGETWPTTEHYDQRHRSGDSRAWATCPLPLCNELLPALRAGQGWEKPNSPSSQFVAGG